MLKERSTRLGRGRLICAAKREKVIRHGTPQQTVKMTTSILSKSMKCFFLSGYKCLPSMFEEEAKKRGIDLSIVSGVQANGETIQPAIDKDGLVSFEGADVLVIDQGKFFAMISEDPKILGLHTDLKWIHATSAGVENIVKSFSIMHQRRVAKDSECNTGASPIISRYGRGFGGLMVEYVLLMMLQRERKLPFTIDAQKESKWIDCSKINMDGAVEDVELDYRSLKGLSICILGFGSIGMYVGDVLRNVFGMKVFGINSSGKMRENDFAGRTICDSMGSMEDVEEFFSQSDYIFNLMPTTKETTDLLSKGQLQACKSSRPGGTTFINAGRGTIISEAALIEALDKGWISHAILDVFIEEPLPPSSPLWQRSDITITPHTAATSMPDEIVSIFFDNAIRYNKNESLLYCVDCDVKGY